MTCGWTGVCRPVFRKLASSDYRQLPSGPSRAGPGPRVWSKRGPPALKAPKNFLGHAIFLLDHALKFTGKTLLLGGHALLYTVGNTIFDEKALLISASGPAGLETFLEETENKEKIQNICLSGPLKAPGPLVTTLATPPPSRRSWLPSYPLL